MSSYSTDPAQVLAARPDLDQALSGYTAMVKDIRDQLDARTRTTGDWSAAGITDTDWPEALAIVKKIGAAAGFISTEVVKDEAGDHDVFIQGPDGAVLFGTKANTILGVQSGCHRISATRAAPGS